jgi:catechol 2,3-dioxygenase
MDATLDNLSSTTVAESTGSDFAVFGPVHLDVTDIDRALAFWHDLIGLDVLGRTSDEARLGAGKRELLVLHPGATSATPRNYSGLYHLALHLPTLGDFARVYTRLLDAQYPQYPTDHVTHLANYADDADRIGLELVFETPQRVRSMTFGPNGFEVIDSSGNRVSGREPIDLEWLASNVPESGEQQAMPAGTVVGHIHLRVPEIEPTLAFYRDIIGFAVNMDNPGIGMSDMSARGSFPHRLAFNVWESAGAPQRPAGMAGLHQLTLEVRSPEELEVIAARAEAANIPVARAGGGIRVHDPAGNAVLLTAAHPDDAA